MNEHLARALETENPRDIVGQLDFVERANLLDDLIREALLDQKGPAIEAIERALTTCQSPSAA